ncbi:MAG: phenylalanine--tRNA ligase subunit beta [Pyrinomonadaceae bacterium]|nr:phenylalanine--tRNA ligase subunit beta [Pyrinomonadaceae bacterium]
MLISYKWLNELVSTGLDAEELSEKLTLIGLEIDGIHAKDDDTIFDIEVTSNRGDCLSHLGVARELSAALAKPINIPEIPSDSPSETSRVVIEDPKDCYRFTARIIEGVKVGPSPDWLVRKLDAVGERSINNIADITNYVMHELGQPMHAFDLDKLKEQRIVVRKARKGESIKTLDEEDRKLDVSVLAICDAESPVAVAGVMGGLDSGVTEETKNVLLEVACFDRDSIRSTSSRLNLSTEASYRFERGVDIEGVVRASNRAASLIAELTNGTLTEFSDVYPKRHKPVSISAPDLAAEFERLSGIALSIEKIDGSLEGLGIHKDSDGAYRIPSWRHDMSIPEDLVEEAARMHGYEKIGEELPRASSAGEYHSLEPRKRRLREVLASNGFDEAMSYSFVDAQKAGAFAKVKAMGAENEREVRIKDPIIEGADLMRPSLVSGLIDAVQTNFNHKALDLSLFEIGKAFATDDAGAPPLERELLGFVITGREAHANTALRGREMDFFDLKGAIETAGDSLGTPALVFRAAEIEHLQKGQSAEILLNGQPVGSAGKLSAEIANTYKFKQPVYIAELDLTAILETDETAATYSPLDVFPSITRDISLVVSDEVSLDQILRTVSGGGFKNLDSVSYVDTYSGKGMESGERSITIRIEYRSGARTLTDDEVDMAHEDVRNTLKSKLNAALR